MTVSTIKPGVKSAIRSSGMKTAAELKAKDPRFAKFPDSDLTDMIKLAYEDTLSGDTQNPSLLDKAGSAVGGMAESVKAHPAAMALGTGALALGPALATGPAAPLVAAGLGAAGAFGGNMIDNVMQRPDRPVTEGGVREAAMGAAGPVLGGVLRAAPTALKSFLGHVPFEEVGKAFTRGTAPWIGKAAELAPEGAARRMLERLVMESPEEAAALARQAPQNFALEAGTEAGAPAAKYLEGRIAGANKNAALVDAPRIIEETSKDAINRAPQVAQTIASSTGAQYPNLAMQIEGDLFRRSAQNEAQGISTQLGKANQQIAEAEARAPLGNRPASEYLRDAENLQGLMPRPAPERTWIGEQVHKAFGPSSHEQGQTMNRWFTQNGFPDPIAQRDLAHGVPASILGGTSQALGQGTLGRILDAMLMKQASQQQAPEEEQQWSPRFNRTPGGGF